MGTLVSFIFKIKFIEVILEFLIYEVRNSLPGGWYIPRFDSPVHWAWYQPTTIQTPTLIVELTKAWPNISFDNIKNKLELGKLFRYQQPKYWSIQCLQQKVKGQRNEPDTKPEFES